MTEADSHTLTWSMREIEGDVGVLKIVGDDSARRMRSSTEPMRLGSGEHADLRIEDRTISRLHCELRQLPGRLEVRDLGSKNGLWIAGCRVWRAEVPAGTRLRIGGRTVELGVERGRRIELRWEGGDSFHDLVGACKPMHRLFAYVARAASSGWPVLFRGESGTGKELLAHAIHAEGKRAGGPFVVVDGGAMSAELADTELFGAVRGAYTGAATNRVGAFERAHGGTLFLDEVADLRPAVQLKLLRVLEDGSYSRVGEDAVRTSDACIVAATSRPLQRMVNEGSFREDLYYRLAQVELEVPPLRERGDDARLIARAMLDAITDDPEVHETLERSLIERKDYPWPGNVRELRSWVRRLVALGDAGVAAPPRLVLSDQPTIDAGVPFKEAKQAWVDHFERRYFRRLLEESGGNTSEAARRANMNRGWLIERMKALGIGR